MYHSIIDIFLVSIIMILSLVFYINRIRREKTYSDLFKLLSKNAEFLAEYQKKQEIIQLKNTIKIYSQFQIILKISKCDYITFFKYDYSNRYVILHFLLSMDSKGCIIQENSLDKLPISGNLLALNVLKTDDTDLYTLYTDEMKGKNDIVYHSTKEKGINKIYYQNVFVNKDNPLGFITLSYKDTNFELHEDDKVEVLRIIENIKSYL